MVIQCDFCMVTVPSEEAMQIHVKGKRHQRIVEIAEQREKQASFTVFTCGFKDDTTEDELRAYFSKFGNIKNIIMEYKRLSLFALVEFEKEESAQAAIAEENHEFKGAKIMVKPRRVKKVPRRAIRAKVTKAKQKATWKAAREDKKAIAVHREEITQKLATGVSIEDQMRILTEFVRMTDEEMKMKQEICDMLQTALAKIFPACTIHQFGSSVNGFGVKGCDADIYLDFHDEDGEGPSEDAVAALPPIKLPYHRDIPSVTKSEGPLTSADLQQMTSHDKVKMVSRVLLDHAIGCNNFLAIPSARCPLIKFTHEPTGIKCDLSINNKLALRNTRLLQLCSRIDDRVGLLVHTIRYWAKVKEIAGNINSGPRLTNYALTFLIIQYLQNLETPLLPTISKLAELAGKEKVIIDGWDCSYLDEPQTCGPSSNTQTLEELLKGFFQYYADIDFSTVVLQTRSGNLLPIQEMIEQIHTGGETQNFKIGPISIQDPFVLDHNIAGNVSEKMKQKISEEFQIAAAKCKMWTKLEDSIEKGEEFGLTKTLDNSIPDDIAVAITRLHQMDEDVEDGNSFTVVLKVAQLPPEAFKNLQTPDFRLNWCFKVCLFVQRVLETILMFETEILAQTISDDEQRAEPNEMVTDTESKPPEESPRKRRSNLSSNTNTKKSREDPIVTPVSEDTTNCSGSKPYAQKLCTLPPGGARSTSLHMELMCSACCRTWNGRKTLRKEVMSEGDLDGLELEKEISEQIIENVGFSSKYLVQFRIDIDTVVQTSKTAVTLKLEPTDGAKEFACFFSFFKTFIRRLVEKNLYEVW